jgi:hypothetical protein
MILLPEATKSDPGEEIDWASSVSSPPFGRSSGASEELGASYSGFVARSLAARRDFILDEPTSALGAIKQVAVLFSTVHCSSAWFLNPMHHCDVTAAMAFCDR